MEHRDKGCGQYCAAEYRDERVVQDDPIHGLEGPQIFCITQLSDPRCDGVGPREENPGHDAGEHNGCREDEGFNFYR